MLTNEKVTQGTPAWFEMVGQVMSKAAEGAALPPTRNVSLIERYTDGVDFGDGLVQGFRFEIVRGKPFYRVGVRPDEQGDITIEVPSAVARELNRMPGDASAVARQNCVATGVIRQRGDPSQLGDWFGQVQQSIIDRTS